MLFIGAIFQKQAHDGNLSGLFFPNASGWWFGTFSIIFHILGMSSSLTTIEHY